MEAKRIVFKKDSSQSWDEEVVFFEVYYDSTNKCYVDGVLKNCSELTREDKDVKFYSLYEIVEIVKEKINKEEYISSAKDYITTIFESFGANVEFLEFELIEKYCS